MPVDHIFDWYRIMQQQAIWSDQSPILIAHYIQKCREYRALMAKPNA